MFEKLPSLRSFQPHFYTGGESRHYIALCYDLVALLKPRRVVVAGSGDGQAFFAICQAARDRAVACECIATPARWGEEETADGAWAAQQEYGYEFYGDLAQFRDGPVSARGSVDLLLIDDVDSASEVAGLVHTWEPMLSPSGLVLLHGTQLGRDDPPLDAWRNWIKGKSRIEFENGIGLGVAAVGAVPPEIALFFARNALPTLALLYELAAARIEAKARATAAERDNAALGTRQIWLDSIVSTGWQAQQVMDHQARIIAELEQKFANLSADRLKAQEIMDGQARQIESMLANPHPKHIEQLEALRRDRSDAQKVMDAQASHIETQAKQIDARTREVDAQGAKIDQQAGEIDAQARRMDEQAREIDAQTSHIHEQAREIAARKRESDAQAREIERRRQEVEALMKETDALRVERGRAELLAQTQTEQLQNFEALRRDRAKAQLVMDAQQEQLQHWVGVHNQLKSELEKVSAELKQRKQLLRSAKEACRRDGKCFRVASGPKVRRPVGERVVRELRRVPRKLGIVKPPPKPPEPAAPSNPAPAETRDPYAEWIAAHEPDAAALERQCEAARQLVRPAKLSAVVPVFNTPPPFLDELVASLVAQTYDNWELCLADGGSDDAGTLDALRRWEAHEPRLKVIRLPGNFGISENTNGAVELATGDFILLADHDDLLPPFAFYEMARAISAHPEADIFYSDEDRWSAEGKRRTPFFKPEWSPELLCSFMYIGHLTAYRRQLVNELGGFRKEFDLSQDYDLALRATERAPEIVHVPHICYHWREHAASGNMGGKPNARRTNLAALGDAMRRRNLPAEIIEYPTANRARLRVAAWPRVSIVVPTDSATRAQACLIELARATKYPDLEIVIVTNSRLIEALKGVVAETGRVVLVPYDQPFNFSDKCNAGAAAATGARVIFFNDDVETEQADWIQNLIEPLENPAVGAVAPKLLYETGKIQHAGLVTGVRGFAGTAFHQRSGDWTDYFNLAQSLRDVSALSGACLAMRRDDFQRLGGFDPVNAPIAHSDFDLCFKIREAGLRCLYTPFATLRHAGHVSIATDQQEPKERARDKANIFLLRRWAGYTTQDPYFTENMRDWLYLDSPTPIRMSGRNEPDVRPAEADLLLISHDLSWSGAPLILLERAKWFFEHGFFVVVMSAKDGPLRAKFAELGIPVIVDQLITTGHESFTAFARDFDCVIANTIFGAPIVNAVKREGIPHLWWIHEGRVAEHYISADQGIRKALAAADTIITPDTRSSQVYQPFSDRPIRVVPYGILDPSQKVAPTARRHDGPVKFLLLGTIEQRKGQQVLLEAIARLPSDVLKNARFEVVGRSHDFAIAEEIAAVAKDAPHLKFSDGVSPDEALTLIAQTDVMISASWDETGPLILMEAAALGKALLSTSVGAISEYLDHDEDALFFRPGDATALAAAIERLVRDPDLLAALGTKARAAYERDFTSERFALQFAELVREVIRGRSALADAALQL